MPPFVYAFATFAPDVVKREMFHDKLCDERREYFV